jgi:hypothetical protein
MIRTQATAADHPRLPFPQARIAASLRSLGRVRRARTIAAADALIDCLNRFVAAGQVPLAAALGDTATPRAWRQYRPGEAGAMDGTAGALHFYYHAHRTPGASPREHGHFHVFAQLGAAGGDAIRYTHLVAIGVDARGMPQRLFTTNRWVTDETWQPADRLIALAARIAAAPPVGNDPVEAWLRAQLGVFAPQIAAVLRHRDRRMAARLQGGHRPGLFEDRRMHVLSQCRISVERQLSALDHVIH